jgi:hypothetical protein
MQLTDWFSDPSLGGAEGVKTAAAAAATKLNTITDRFRLSQLQYITTSQSTVTVQCSRDSLGQTKLQQTFTWLHRNMIFAWQVRAHHHA